jgi:hypothetical protein
VIYEADKQLAYKLLEELLENLPRFHFAEWVDGEGNESPAKCFLMAISIPLLSLKSLLEGNSLIAYF